MVCLAVKDDIAQFAITSGFNSRVGAHCRNFDARPAGRRQDGLARHRFNRPTVDFQLTGLKARFAPIVLAGVLADPGVAQARLTHSVILHCLPLFVAVTIWTLMANRVFAASPFLLRVQKTPIEKE
jgi:hypothetical protein